ncbi:thioesterase family protein [Nocardioides sp. cx-173]|uniref:thioesterase family protein n=1 Tax=Nocardioides sp. cx-173 TaxID=2898796 RepID=UPI001E44CA08|nr:thioesterase family protein [Nocardioides sp. cx-173]MCD4527423.1 thioesterase family protein [Nocardioides sp. cx-173]UGB41238.1 thioesterase family protein [Nocardioides sp. cx-173]
MTAQPSYDQIAALPAYSQQGIPAAFEDFNGHLNVRHYLGIASEGLDESLVEVGIPQNWPHTAGQAVFSAEHHLTYFSELRTGDKISVRVRLVGRSRRAAHVVVYLLDDSHSRVSYVMEEILLHMDMETRKTSDWPEDVARQIDARLAEEKQLGWEPMLSGSMSLR